MTDAGHVFYEFSDALLFPGYFGWNWDALSDCLRDLSWLPADGYLIVIENAPRLLSSSVEDQHTLPDPVGGRTPLGEPARPTTWQGRSIHGAAAMRPRRGDGTPAKEHRQRTPQVRHLIP
ncbi:barstar family protein [Micromonospora sp. S4605]|uniref:barstar family protein n=1 Tax=Micromonospora sp. S4605 TaxID=1420897 RepID=UPI001E2BB006|nr:barstar family protein [Micromonospora sp. S4605]